MLTDFTRSTHLINAMGMMLIIRRKLFLSDKNNLSFISIASEVGSVRLRPRGYPNCCFVSKTSQIFPYPTKRSAYRLNEVLAFLQIAKRVCSSLSPLVGWVVLSLSLQPPQPHLAGTSTSPSSHIFYLWSLPASRAD